MNKFFKKGKSNSVGIFATLIIACLTFAAVFFYFQFTRIYVVVANKTIPAGTQITSAMLQDESIKLKEINKTFFDEQELPWVVQDINSLENQYVQSELKRGKIIYSYDIASRYDIRTNPYLQDNNYEAFALTTGTFSLGKTTNLLEKGDRINIYAVYNLDLSSLKEIKEYETASGSWGGDGGIANYYGVRVSELPEYAKDICVNAGMKETDFIYEDEITLARLVYQNVPIINITKTGTDPLTASISEMIIGVDSKTASELYVLMEKASLGCTLLPYINGEYDIIDNTATTDVAIGEFGKVFESAQITD